MPTPRTTQLATMTDADITARVTTKVTDEILDRLATIPLAEAVEQLAAEARMDQAGEELGERWDGLS